MNWRGVNPDDEARLSAFMARVGQLPAPQGLSDSLPGHRQIWWKAQLLRRWDAERRVTAPIDFIQPLELAAGLACLVFFLYRALPFVF